MMIDEVYEYMMLKLKDILSNPVLFQSQQMQRRCLQVSHMLPSQATGSAQVSNCCQLCWL